MRRAHECHPAGVSRQRGPRRLLGRGDRLRQERHDPSTRRRRARAPKRLARAQRGKLAGRPLHLPTAGGKTMLEIAEDVAAARLQVQLAAHRDLIDRVGCDPERTRRERKRREMTGWQHVLATATGTGVLLLGKPPRAKPQLGGGGLNAERGHRRQEHGRLKRAGRVSPLRRPP